MTLEELIESGPFIEAMPSPEPGLHDLLLSYYRTHADLLPLSPEHYADAYLQAVRES